MNIPPFRLRRLKALTIKEFHQIRRDPSSLLIAVIFPILLLFLYGYGVSLDIDNLKIGVINQDRSSEATTFSNALKYSKFFSVTEEQDQKKLESALIAGSIHGIVTIPFYFEKYLKMNQAAPIFVVADGQSPNTASFVQNYVQGAFMNWKSQQQLEDHIPSQQLIQVLPRYWYNERLDSHYFLVPGSIGIIMTLVGTLLTALVIAREWERGTIEAIMATPMTMIEFVTAKMLAHFCLGMFSMLFCFLAGIFIFRVPFQGSFIWITLTSMLFVFVSLAGGLWISSFSKDQFIASQIAIMSSFLPAYSLSGFIFEVSSMPTWIQFIAQFVPAKYFVSSLQTLFLVGDVHSLLISNLFFLILLAIIPIFMILKNSKKVIE